MFKEKLKKIIDRFNFLEKEMQGHLDRIKLEEYSKEYSHLKHITGLISKFFDVEREILSTIELLKDEEFASLAENELSILKGTKENLEKELKLLLIPKDVNDDRSVIIEIRAGTGGDEASLFALDLFRMYQRFADENSWKVEVIEESTTDLGGLKEVVFHLKGESIFSKLKFESGVHRVQRVPATESSGRIHTSAATVAVLPEAKEVDIEIVPTEIRIDTMRASGAGGQHVNTTDSAVRITHLPTGIVVTSSEKSQHQNRAKAMEVLRTRLYDLKIKQQSKEIASKRKSQIGSGDRSERIRTYNFPQGRVTDHRINLTLYKLDEILNGDLLEIINGLMSAERLEAMLAYENDN
ncbi:peptide chain release factor 1 [Paracoccaceae bacterium]|nr:peptide chain release factor 1 [Paracoccaceae bacterium]